MASLGLFIPANAECCGRGKWYNIDKTIPGVGNVSSRQWVCDDCTAAMSTFCGYDSCNIFGCNCRCRRGACDSRRRRDVENSGEAIVNAGDVNGDGNFSLAEAETLLSRKGLPVNRRVVRSLDVNNDGRLSAEEIEEEFSEAM
jgi:hypothetical protein